MPLALETMHQRYLQQASWTAELRCHLFTLAQTKGAHRVLEVGSGTGAILKSFDTGTNRDIYGLDIDFHSLQFARKDKLNAHQSAGDAHKLPYPSGSFDVVFCHFLLLWVEKPEIVLTEMQRVTRTGGAVLALAEPDYGGRIDYPEALAPLGAWQAESLQRQGADPQLGRKLAGLFHAAGFEDVESGVLGAQWSRSSREDHSLEWEILRTDLEDYISTEQLTIFRKEEERARKRGDRVLYVPTFYAWGKVR